MPLHPGAAAPVAANIKKGKRNNINEYMVPPTSSCFSFKIALLAAFSEAMPKLPSEKLEFTKIHKT